jgi:predicted XRE-type DNA-binding protein
VRDDIGSWLGANRSRIADLRNKKLDRFSLESLIRFAIRLNYRVELKIEKIERPYSKRPDEKRG